LFEAGGARAAGFGDGGFGGALVVAQIDESGFDVGFNAGGGSGGRPFGFDGHGFKLVLELDHHAFGGLAADAGDFREAGEIASANGGHEFFDVHAGENFEGEAGADTGSAKEQLEEMLFAGREKAVEGEGIFADVRVDEQRDFGVEFAECSESGKGHGNEIADAADIHDDLIGPLFQEAAAQESNHRSRVLPRRRRLSTRGPSGRSGFPLVEEGEDIGGGQGAGGLKFTVFLAEEKFASGIEHGDGGNTAIERHIVLLGEIEILVAMADVHVDDHKIFCEGGGDFGTVKGVVEGVAVEAPIGTKDDKNTFVQGRGGMERFVDFLFGVSGGGIEIFLLGSLTQSRGAKGWGEGQGEWMQENQEQCE